MVRRSSVRRRVKESDDVPAHLRLSACPPVWVDDRSLSLRERCDSFDRWLAAFMAWQTGRWAWFDVNGWPGGLEAMQAETPDVPDGPFDPSRI